ncbi:MAG: SMI1/KNR4 family protein [Sphingopyxis sp.]
MRTEQLVELVRDRERSTVDERVLASKVSLGFQLPDDYRGFLEATGGGGVVHVDTFQHLVFSISDFSFEPVIFFGPDEWDSKYSVQAMAADYSGNVLTIDLRPESLGKVGVHVSTHKNTNIEEFDRHTVIADSFSEFQKSLRLEMRTPISPDRARGAGLWAVLHMIAYFAAAGLVWGLALGRSVIWFAAIGASAGFLIGFLFGFLVVSRQTTEEKARDVMFAVGATWGNLAILSGAAGLIVWVVRVVFF